MAYRAALGFETFQILYQLQQHRTYSWPQRPRTLFSGCHSMMYTSLYYPFLSRCVNSFQYILSSGYVMWGIQSMATKATSPPCRMAQKLIITKFLYCPVHITMYPKASQTLETHNLSGSVVAFKIRSLFD